MSREANGRFVMGAVAVEDREKNILGKMRLGEFLGIFMDICRASEGCCIDFCRHLNENTGVDAIPAKSAICVMYRSFGPTGALDFWQQ